MPFQHLDLDECGVELSTAERGIGKAYVGKRVKQAGLYSKSDKYNLLLAISGDPAGHRWRDIWTGEGTTGDRMIEFIETIINDLGPGTPARRYCFIMDNLRYVLVDILCCLCITLLFNMNKLKSPSFSVPVLTTMLKWLQSYSMLGIDWHSGHHIIQSMDQLNMYSIQFNFYYRSIIMPSTMVHLCSKS